jgi:ribosomal protein S7
MLNKGLSTNLYKKVLGFLIKKGKVSAAKQILDNSILLASKHTGIPMEMVLLKVFLKLNIFVEVKRIKIRRRTFFVPFPITIKRRTYLILKWVLESSSRDKHKQSLEIGFSKEIIQILTNNSSKSLKSKSDNLALALSNRSNAHYRW